MSTKIIKKTKVIQTRLDADLIDKASEILDYMGLSATDAVRMLLKNIVNTGNFPLELKKPRTIEIPKNPPILQLSPEKIAEIEQKLDDYYAGKMKTTELLTDQEIENYFFKLNPKTKSKIKKAYQSHKNGKSISVKNENIENFLQNLAVK